MVAQPCPSGQGFGDFEVHDNVDITIGLALVL